jgi:enoyl-CoA hydratase/carnithine racemase
MGEFVQVDVDQAIATIRLTRPPMNAISAQLTAELATAAVAVNDDEQIRAVVVYGGEKVFAAGADIKEMADAGYTTMTATSRRLQDALNAVARIGKPVVAAITGYALGGGLELALCADFRVAGERAKRPAGDLARPHPWRGRHATASEAHRPRQGQGHRFHRQVRGRRRGTRDRPGRQGRS